MKALTVQQPWAWAIVHGGKDVENRTQAWGYRGPLAIHAGRRWSTRGAALVPENLRGDDVRAAYDRLFSPDGRPGCAIGAIIGVVDLVDAHDSDACASEPHGEMCSPWAEASYVEHSSRPGQGRTRRDVVHLLLANPRPLAVPVPCKGRLGLWTLPPDVERLVATGRVLVDGVR